MPDDAKTLIGEIEALIQMRDELRKRFTNSGSENLTQARHEFVSGVLNNPDTILAALRAADMPKKEKATPPLLKALIDCANFIEGFEADWEELTDGNHGTWEGIPVAKAARKAIAAALAARSAEGGGE